MIRPANWKEFCTGGVTADLAAGVVEHWLLGLEKRNPALLGMFRDRDVKPYRDLLPWSGEFIGKHITGAYYVWRITRDQRLFDETVALIDRFVACQAEDGYLGCFSRDCRLTGAFSQNPDKTGETWDSWNHYHAMFGLLKWHELTGCEAWLTTVLRMADKFMDSFYYGKKRIVDIGSSEMNLAVLHTFVLLYEKTQDARYLDFAHQIEGDLPDPAAGDYMTYALNDLPFWKCPKPRWESLHVIMGIAEMYVATGEEKYLRAAKQIFFSILETDVHNTGAFSTNEQAVGNPYQSGAIETCCVLAYNALGSLLYEITGDIRIVEHLEKSHYNAMMGSFSPTGAWSTYDTPMNGTRKANYHDIVFQSRPGSPELNCCSVNAPRGATQIADWAVATDDDVIIINNYEKMTGSLDDGTALHIDGVYPYDGAVRICLDTAGKTRSIRLRIPAWTKQAEVTFGGRTVSAEPGVYYMVEGVFTPEKPIDLRLDMTRHVEVGAGECNGMACITVGTLVMGLDATDHPALNIGALPPVTSEELLNAAVSRTEDGGMELKLDNGMLLRDFYHLGVSGSSYRTWLPLND